MLSSIADLWFGNIEPAKELDRHNDEIKELEMLLQRNSELLRNFLSKEEAVNRLEIYSACVDEYLSIITKTAFSEGFKLGTRFIVESLT